MGPPARFAERSRTREDVRAELKARLRRDFTYRSGRIIGTMISEPHPLAKEVFAEFLEKNAGDPGVYPATAELEVEAVGMLAELVGMPRTPRPAGQLLTGGNEANILALWSAKSMAGRAGQVIVPENAHFSYTKAARLLDLELVHVPLDRGRRMDIAATRAAITPETIALVGVAGSTDLGNVDPIAELSELALERDLHLHVDAAFGGFVLPFLADLGRPAPPFDFQLPGVASMTIDPHKMGLCVQPAGAVLFRDDAMARAVSTDIAYLAGGKTAQVTLTGTRSGAAVLAVWAVLSHLGREGYREVVRACMDKTDFLLERLATVAGLEVVNDPPAMNIVGVRATGLSVQAMAAGLRRHGWTASEFPGHIRIVVLPHLRKTDLETFVEDLCLVVHGGRCVRTA